jgi:chromosome partitioning protein
MIIGLLNQKGGVGKTTVTLNLAAYFAREGFRTLVVDADPQASAMSWSSAREAAPLFPVIGMATPTLHRDLPSVAADYAVTLIDGAPRVNDLGRSAILASDLVIIPITPSPFDVWAADQTVQLVKEAQQFKDNIRAVFTVNRKVVNTAIGRDVADAFAGSAFSVLPTPLSQRVIFAESAAQGLTVLEVDPNSEASREVRSLGLAITLLQNQRRAAA